MAHLEADSYYAVLPEWVLLHPDLSDRAVRLYGLLRRYADRQLKAWPSRRTLAEGLRCSRDSVDRALTELEAAGALTRQLRVGADGLHDTTLYQLASLPPGGGAAPMPRGGRTAAATGGRKAAAQNTQPVEPQPPSGGSSTDAAARWWEQPGVRHLPAPWQPDPKRREVWVHLGPEGKVAGSRDLLWEALLGGCRLLPAEMTARARGAANRALLELRQVGATPRELTIRAGRYRSRWEREPSPSALASQWPMLAGPAAKVAAAQPEPEQLPCRLGEAEAGDPRGPYCYTHRGYHTEEDGDARADLG
jgi:predicted transcriptional regulator